MSKGKIFLVGFGPGAKEHMSLRALEAMEQSDVVIGYSTYIKLVKDLLVGKEIIRKGMTEEIDRCIEAYEQAKLGKIVSLISSGDIGVYGMAGPTFEVLIKEGWTPDSDIEVEIVPGSTALSACASLVGAPLTHDFCSISLSDLLTPWPTIAKRLDAAGAADFVIALYNPKSSRRVGQIETAQEILLRHRKPETPVAVVKSAYRRRQNIQLVRLDQMQDCEIGMLTTVLIGNSTTFLKDGLMITPRGYANKYEGITGEALDGEQKGRSLSMGLMGWHGVVREYIRGGDFHSLHQVADHFDSPLEEIMQAISDGTEDDDAADYQAIKLAGDPFKIIEQAKDWGQLRAVIRSRSNIVGEITIKAEDLKQKGERLNIVNDAFHLHIRKDVVHSLWLIQKGDRFRSAFFMDKDGHVAFNFTLLKNDGNFETEARENFDTAFDAARRQASSSRDMLETTP